MKGIRVCIDCRDEERGQKRRGRRGRGKQKPNTQRHAKWACQSNSQSVSLSVRHSVCHSTQLNFVWSGHCPLTRGATPPPKFFQFPSPASLFPTLSLSFSLAPSLPFSAHFAQPFHEYFGMHKAHSTNKRETLFNVKVCVYTSVCDCVCKCVCRVVTARLRAW